MRNIFGNHLLLAHIPNVNKIHSCRLVIRSRHYFPHKSWFWALFHTMRKFYIQHSWALWPSTPIKRWVCLLNPTSIGLTVMVPVPQPLGITELPSLSEQDSLTHIVSPGLPASRMGYKWEKGINNNKWCCWQIPCWTTFDSWWEILPLSACLHEVREMRTLQRGYDKYISHHSPFPQ